MPTRATPPDLSRAFFVSDIHIKSAGDENARRFLAFLDKCLELRPEHLFLVGDIFDLWIADRRFFVEEYARIIARLREVRDAGVTVHYFEGNHDLDLDVFWRDALAFDVRGEAAYYKLGPLEVRVEHGDQMDPEDRGYLFLRWLLRTPALRFLGRRLPDALVRWIGRRASHASRDYTSTVKAASDERVREKIRAHARRAFREKPFHLLVSGHTHVRDDQSLDEGGNRFRCLGLGTWLKEPLVLDVHDSSISLRPLAEFLAGG